MEELLINIMEQSIRLNKDFVDQCEKLEAIVRSLDQDHARSICLNSQKLLELKKELEIQVSRVKVHVI